MSPPVPVNQQLADLRKASPSSELLLAWPLNMFSLCLISPHCKNKNENLISYRIYFAARIKRMVDFKSGPDTSSTPCPPMQMAAHWCL